MEILTKFSIYSGITADKFKFLNIASFYHKFDIYLRMSKNVMT